MNSYVSWIMKRFWIFVKCLLRNGFICFIGSSPCRAPNLRLHRDRRHRFGPVPAALRGFVHLVRVDRTIMLVERPIVVGHLFPTPWAWLLQGWAFRVLICIFPFLALPLLAVRRIFLMLDQCVRVPSDKTPADWAVLAWVFVKWVAKEKIK